MNISGRQPESKSSRTEKEPIEKKAKNLSSSLLVLTQFASREKKVILCRTSLILFPSPTSFRLITHCLSHVSPETICRGGGFTIEVL